MLNFPTYQSFTIEDEIVHHLMLQTAFIQSNGLLYGKMGIAVVFLKYGINCNNLIFIDFAEELKNSICKKINDKTPLDFATGLLGVGWGIEYMIQHLCVNKYSDEVCKDIDHRIMILNMKRIKDFSLESGIDGFLHYILIRLKSAKIRKTSSSFDDIFLKDIYSIIKFMEGKVISSSVKQSFISFIETDLLNYEPDISLFATDIEIKDIEDILAAKLGLAEGLAGKLIKIIEEKKSFQL